MKKQDTLASLIVDTALEISDGESWSGLTLGKIADQLDLPLADIYGCYPDLDDVANAWIRRADFYMAEGASSAVGDGLETGERLHVAIMCWIRALQGRRHTMRDILFYKLKPPHFHLQAHGITRISRTVQWFLAAAGREYTGVGRTADDLSRIPESACGDHARRSCHS